MKTINRRASTAPLQDVCQASAYGQNDEIVINRSDRAGCIGSAVHEACAALVNDAPLSIDAVRSRYNLPESTGPEIAQMIAAFSSWWAQYQEHFQEPKTELYMEHDGTTGHTDLLGRKGDICHVADVKTTRLQDADYKAQLIEYCWLAAHTQPPSLYYQYHIVYVRDWTQEVGPLLTRNQLDGMHNSLEAKVLNWDGKTYNPSGACLYCPRMAVCPGLSNEIVNTVARFLPDMDMEERMKALTDAQCVDLWPKITMALNLLDNAYKILRMRATKAGRLKGSRRVVQSIQRERRAIIARKAWDVLCNHFSKDVILEHTAIANAVTYRLRPAGISSEAIWAELEKAGAVRHTLYNTTGLYPSEAAANEAMPKEIKGV